MKPADLGWDPRKEQEMRMMLSELRALEEQGTFDGLDLPETPPPSLIRGEIAKDEARGRLVARRITMAPLQDGPAAPPLAQFMTQLAVRERTSPYKLENQKRFDEAVVQVRSLFGRIARGEVASASMIRAIVGSFLDTFMKDRNLVAGLAAHPYHGPDYLYDHALKLCLLSLSLASAANYSRSQAIEIAQGALLADIGMMLVPEPIRAKRGKLAPDELREVQKHPLLGLALLEPIHGLSEPTLLIALQHHERLSGAGYPDKRAGTQLSRFSRIVGIADVFTALVNKRSYRDALLPYNAMVSILSMGGQGLLDGDHIRSFLRTLSIFPLGSLVRLSTGRIGKVVAPNSTEFTKPVVSLLTAENGAPLAPNLIQQLDLAKVSGVTIVEALPGTALGVTRLDGF